MHKILFNLELMQISMHAISVELMIGLEISYIKTNSKIA